MAARRGWREVGGGSCRDWFCLKKVGGGRKRELGVIPGRRQKNNEVKIVYGRALCVGLYEKRKGYPMPNTYTDRERDEESTRTQAKREPILREHALHRPYRKHEKGMHGVGRGGS